jgi:hypothetical protein
MRTLGVFRPFAVLGTLSVGLTGCFGKMYVPAPTATYDISEGGETSLGKYEKELMDAVNARLVKEGFPAAKVGSYEMKLALLEAEVCNQKTWSTSHRQIDQSFIPDPDEVAGNDASKVHMYHWLLARGVEVPDGVWDANHSDDFAKRTLRDSDLDKMWFYLRPDRKPKGELKIGVAILGDGWDSKRYFAVVVREDRIELTKGPPRTIDPGSTFDIEGRVLTSGRPLRLAVLHPDGKVVDFQTVDVQSDGQFSVSYQVPKDSGRYVLSLGDEGRLVNVPVFAGIAPAPWPAYPGADTADPDNTRGGAKEFATAIEGWRKGQGLAPLPLPADLCAFAKAEAKRSADESSAPLAESVSSESFKERARAAGLDPEKVHRFVHRLLLSAPDEVNLHHNWEAFVTRAPWDPFEAAVLMSPKVTQLAIGAVPEPQKSPDDPKFIDLVWIGVEGDTATAPAKTPSATR